MQAGRQSSREDYEGGAVGETVADAEARGDDVTGLLPILTATFRFSRSFDNPLGEKGPFI
jgi:hypothetical protein